MKGISGEGDYQRNGRYCAWRSFAGLPQTKRPEQSTISSHLRSPAVLRPDVVANIARKGYKRLEIDLENRYSGTDRVPRLNKAIDINCSILWRRQSRCVVVDDIYTYIYIYWAEKEKRTRGKKKKKGKRRKSYSWKVCSLIIFACIEEILREKDTPRSLKDAVEWSASFFLSYWHILGPKLSGEMKFSKAHVRPFCDEFHKVICLFSERLFRWD